MIRTPGTSVTTRKLPAMANADTASRVSQNRTRNGSAGGALLDGFGAPQCGQWGARVLTSFSHSRQVTMGMACLLVWLYTRVGTVAMAGDNDGLMPFRAFGV